MKKRRKKARMGIEFECGVTLMHGDCLEEMKKIPDGSVDMILADLPYGVTDNKWDFRIPLDVLWEQYERIITNNGVILLFGTEPFSSFLRMSNIRRFKYDWIWEKPSGLGFQHARNMPLKRHEIISVFSKAPIGHKSLLGDRRMKYFPQGVNEHLGKKVVDFRIHGNCLGPRPNQIGREYEASGNYPVSVLKFKRDAGLHPTQKPVALLEYLIKTYTNEGETVLDNVMGSGSTGVAAVNTGRKFIGIELDKKFYETAKNRIEKAIEEKTEPAPEAGF